MASNGSPDDFAPDTVLAAMATMRGGDADKKKVAMDYLSKFQKSKGAWTTTLTILQSNAEPEATLFAATTLKGKITYDLTTQVPEGDLPALREGLLRLLAKYAAGPRPVRVQLCVCLAILAIQMRTWKDVLATVVSALGSEVQSHAAILDFLRVLPEEVTEGRKITLSVRGSPDDDLICITRLDELILEDELTERTTELLADNAEQVVNILINYAQSSEQAACNPQLMECITSWLREVPIAAIVKSALLNVVINALGNDACLEAAADCLGAICRETRDVDDNVETIQILLPRIIELRPRMQKAAEEEDTEGFKALTRLFADAGESWNVVAAREPAHFRTLIEIILECCARDKDREVIDSTFHFWYDLKQYVVLDNYVEARMQFYDIFASLVDVLLQHLRYPVPESGNELDLFDGDREQEEKFRDFRHQMGDTLKDCCEVMGISDSLTKILDAIKLWMSKYASQVTETSVPNWQELEAPVFGMRALGRMVEKDETTILPQLMPLLVQMPNHEKLRFATIMVFGRYTEWTAHHPEFLEPQFNYIVSSFQADSKEIVRAAAAAIKYFCTDCKSLLSGQVVQMQTFYDQVLDQLPGTISQEEITEGVASVVGVQKNEDIYKLLKLYCDPLVQRLMTKANAASADEKGNDKGKLALADHIQLLTLFVQNVIPSVPYGQEDPAVKYWQEVFPVLATILDNFIDFPPLCERVCRCWRNMVISYRSGITPLLPQMANKLAEGFAASRQGAFLWATGSILREFSEDREHVDASIPESIYQFFENQATNVLRFMSDIPANQLPDIIEDFFRLLTDALLYYPQKLVLSPLITPILQAAISSLSSLEQREPLSATLHFMRDLLSYGGRNPVASNLQLGAAAQQVQDGVKQLLISQGEPLVQAILAGMMMTFPRDCFADGSGVLLEMFDLLPAQTTAWVETTLKRVSHDNVTPVEADRLVVRIKEKLSVDDAGGLRQVRVLLQDFTNTYRRRYIAPRDGLGMMEGKRFHFEG